MSQVLRMISDRLPRMIVLTIAVTFLLTSNGPTFARCAIGADGV